MAENFSEVMNTEQAAAFLGCSRSRLEIWRGEGKGPTYSRVGRLIRYRRSVLIEWLAANEVRAEGLPQKKEEV